VRWFRRLADVPGLSYEGSQTVDRTRLPGHDLEPEMQKFEEFEFYQDLYSTLMWPTPDGGTTSASPVHQRVFGSGVDATPWETLRRLEETLELPGELPDYHFAIQHAYEAIYKRRRKDPSLLEEVERLCRLDMKLVEYYLKSDEYEPDKIYQVIAYSRLVTLYEGEGYFHEALEVAERGLSMGQEHLARNRDRLSLVLQELEAEDVGH